MSSLSNFQVHQSKCVEDGCLETPQKYKIKADRNSRSAQDSLSLEIEFLGKTVLLRGVPGDALRYVKCSQCEPSVKFPQESFLLILHLSKSAGPELPVFQVRKFRSDERIFRKCYPEVPGFQVRNFLSSFQFIRNFLSSFQFKIMSNGQMTSPSCYT